MNISPHKIGSGYISVDCLLTQLYCCILKMQPPPKLSSHLIDGLGRLIADHGHGSHALEIPPDTEAMLLQLEVAVQELRSSLIAAGPVAFRPQQDLAADSNEHVGQQWAMCCSLWVSRFQAR